MTLSQMQYYKQQKGYSYAKLSELSGVPVGTIQKIFSGETKNPRYETLQALEKVLRPTDYGEGSGELGQPDMTGEPASYMRDQMQGRSGIFGKMGQYTLEDYYALPDERRVELIDGVIWLSHEESLYLKTQNLFKILIYNARYVNESCQKTSKFS